MSLLKIVVNDYGQTLKLTFTDVDTDAAADISAYSTAQQVILKDPGGNSATKTAAFDSDGSDGIVKYTLADGDIDEAGGWAVRGKVTSSTAVLTTEWAYFDVMA